MLYPYPLDTMPNVRTFAEWVINSSLRGYFTANLPDYGQKHAITRQFTAIKCICGVNPHHHTEMDLHHGKGNYSDHHPPEHVDSQG